MGLLRVLLAFSVVAAHLGFPFGFGGRNSVQIFFVISGYLMSHVLVEKKVYERVLHFWINRLFRIFPTYWVVLCVTLIFILLGVDHEWWTFISGLPIEALLISLAVNLTLFFQDFLIFLGIGPNGAIVFSPSFDSTFRPLHLALLVPQSWSLALELSFYSLAPFILKRKWLILTLFASSLLLRVVIIGLGVGTNDPWTYRFFPVEIGTFLAGACLHQFVAPRISKFDVYKSKKLSLTLVILFAAFAFAFPWVENNFTRYSLLATLCILGLPALFNYQGQSRLDNELGKLSYPIYLWHVLVISVLNVLIPKAALSDSTLFFAATCTITIGISLATVQLLDKKVDKFRGRFRKAK